MLPSGRAFYCMARGWMDNPAFADQPLTEREAWLWLIEAAAYQPETQNVSGQAVSVARGELVASAGYLGKAWGWERTTAWRFLGRLEKRGMISRRPATGGATPLTLVTVCNYSAYQLAPGTGATGGATPLQQVVQHPPATAPNVQKPRQSRPAEHDAPERATPQCNSECNEKANKALKKGGQGSAEAAALLDAFAQERAQFTGGAGWKAGPKDRQLAEAWAIAGVTAETVRAVAAAQCRKMVARHQGLPFSLAVIDRDISEAQAAAREAAQADPERDQWLAALTSFGGYGPAAWLGERWGAAPGEPDCRMPRRLQDEALSAWRSQAGKAAA